MIVGFTGTRKGMSHQQLTECIKLLIKLKTKTIFDLKPISGMHGDCVGADADFDSICRGLDIRSVCRPCDLKSFRANSPAVEISPPKHPMERNKDIVSDSDVMIACPHNFEHIQRGSGTWATIGMAKSKPVDLHIIYPDGVIEFISSEIQHETE